MTIQRWDDCGNCSDTGVYVLFSEHEAEVAELERQLAEERRLWCDKPEDRMYHAADNTWWMRGPDGSPKAADEPPCLDTEARKEAEVAREALKMACDDGWADGIGAFSSYIDKATKAINPSRDCPACTILGQCLEEGTHLEGTKQHPKESHDD